MIHYKQYSFDKNQLNNRSIERRVMGNKEIIEEINKKIEICKEKINSKNSNKIISDIEKLIEKYNPENDIQRRIINNRISEVNALKNTSKKTKEKNTETL
jgi:MinD-like ATPase involved in chromosome partitioning or flagellar assembly